MREYRLYLEDILKSAAKVQRYTEGMGFDVEWRKIAGLRDVLAPTYFRLNEAILWDVVQNRIPLLLEQIKRILETDG